MAFKYLLLRHLLQVITCVLLAISKVTATFAPITTVANLLVTGQISVWKLNWHQSRVVMQSRSQTCIAIDRLALYARPSRLEIVLQWMYNMTELMRLKKHLIFAAVE